MLKPLGPCDLLVVVDRGERVVEVVEQLSPLLVRRRAAEAFGVVFEAVPLDQQQVVARSLDTARERQANEAAHRLDRRPSFGERILKGRFLTRHHRKHRVLEDHADADTVMLVGHNPGLETLVALLTEGASDSGRGMPPGAVAWLALPAGSIEPGTARVRHFWWP